MNAILRYALAAAMAAGLLTADPGVSYASKVAPMKDGELIVEDMANLFSRDGVKKARDEFAQTKSTHERRVTVLTLASLPKAEADRLDEINKAKDSAAVHRFWVDFTKREAKDEKAKGVFILVCRHPGHVEIIADSVMQENGFNNSKEDRIKEILLTSFRDAKDKPEAEATTIRDKGLLEASRVLHNEVPVTTDVKPAHAVAGKEGSKSSGIMGYVCIGLAVLAGLWLIFGLIRAFTGGGGGGGGMGGGMGGGGGGGFMTGLLGGLFGSMAGMWLYNNMFGGGMSSAFGADGSSSADYNSGGGDEAGTGDFSGDSGSGGDFDGGGSGGDTGGGDWGGGGGDTGGGGDWGGGGGDFGGGGGDF